MKHNGVAGKIMRTLYPRRLKKNVALVLSGGGARGYAHIGAIEVLVERGYRITSIAGTSMGALVGGLYAAGKLDELKRRVLTLDRRKILGLMNISLGLDHVANGERLMKLIDELTHNETIENLPVKFCCIASDIVSGKERVFRSGPLCTAVRASVSIPCFFKPVHEDGHIDVDGSIHNPLPLDRVDRKWNDLLVAVNVSAPDSEPFTGYLQHSEPANDTERKLRSRLPFFNIQFSENYMTMATRVARISLQNNTQMAMRLTPPDVCMELPMNRYSLFDFDKGEELIEYGRREMERQLDAFRAGG